jgi:hypothetical protein
MKTRGMVAIGLSIVFLSLPHLGCGGSGSSSSAPLSTTQAEEATSDVFDAMEEAEASAGLFRAGTGKTEFEAIRSAHPSESSAAPSIGGAEIVPAVHPLTTTSLGTYTWTCPSGGNIVVTGSYSGTATSASVSVTEAINSCGDSGFVIKGNPNVTLTDSYTESGTTFTDNATMSGGFTVSGSGGGSCSINVTESFTENTTTGIYSLVMSGSICGESLNYNYSN